MWPISRAEARGFTLLEVLVAMAILALIGLLLVLLAVSGLGLTSYASVSTGLQQEAMILNSRLLRDFHRTSAASLSWSDMTGSTNCQCLCLHLISDGTFGGQVSYQNSLTSYLFDVLTGSLTRRTHNAPIPLIPLTIDTPVKVQPSLFPNLEAAQTRSERVAVHLQAFTVSASDPRLVRLVARFSEVVPGRVQPCVFESKRVVYLENP